MGAGNLPTIKDLLNDLGVPDSEKDAFRDDIFDFLNTQTKSKENTLKLVLSEINRLSKQFVDSDKGWYYFERSESGSKWSHKCSRNQVEGALPDLIRRYIRNKKDSLRQNDSPHLSKTGKALATGADSFSATSEFRPTMLSAYRPTKQTALTNCSKPRTTLAEVDDDDTICLPDIPYDGNTSDRSSLPEISDIIHCRTTRKARYVVQDWSETPEPQPQPQEPQETASRTLLEEENARLSTEPIASYRTPQKAAIASIPSPPLTLPKRKQDQLDERIEGVSEALNCNENNHNKRAREDHNDRAALTTRDSTVETGEQDLRSGVDGSTASLLVKESQLSISTEHQSDQPSRTHQLTSQPTMLIANLSDTGNPPQKLRFTTEDLLQIPSTVLNYIRRCERSSLNKLNATEVTQAERARLKERCKVFRDLRADIESRIVRSAYNEAKMEGGMGDDQSDQGNSKSEISSYALWD